MAQLSERQLNDLAAARAETVPTYRFTSPGAEEIIHEPFHVLDHGLIRLVDYMGDDRSIPQSARVSYGRGTKSAQSDEGLIRYLMQHWHTTPFEMVQAKFHVVLPIFVARQWMRHRASTFNEYSARYSILDREFYIPEPEHLAAQSKINNQGRGEVLSGEEAELVLEMLKRDASQAYDDYRWMLNEDDEGHRIDPSRLGLARELARNNLPVSAYTQFYWSINAHNLFHFLRLRQDHHAQYEIRAYADTIAQEIVAKWIPISHQAFEDFRRNATQLSSHATAFVNAAILAAAEGRTIDPAQFGMKKRELGEVLASLPALSAHIVPTPIDA